MSVRKLGPWARFAILASSTFVVLVVGCWVFRYVVSHVGTGLPVGWQPAGPAVHAIDCGYAAENFDTRYASRPATDKCDVTCSTTNQHAYGFPFSTLRNGSGWGTTGRGVYCAPDKNRLAMGLNWIIGAVAASSVAWLIVRPARRRQDYDQS